MTIAANNTQTGVIFREAVIADVETIAHMLAAASLGKWSDDKGFDVDPEPYLRAFHEIDADPRNRLIVGEVGGRVVSCLQLTFIPGLTYIGGERAQIEGVRVDASMRGAGIGRAMIRHVIDIARRRGCVLIQLASDKRRLDAHEFYKSLGFQQSHEGMKFFF